MAKIPKPTVLVDIAWQAYNRGLLTFDTSLFDGTDAFAVSSFDVTWSGAGNDVSAQVESFHYERGADDDAGQTLAGGGSLTLRDPSGTYNPNNAGSPLAAVLADRLHPCRIRIKTASVALRTVFYGYARRPQFQPSRRRHTATIELVDLFYWLEGAYPTIASTGPTTVGAAIGKVLDAVGWIDPAMRNLGVGDTIPDFAADGKKTALQLIADLLTADRGYFYINGQGQAAYEDRWQRQVRAVAATIDRVMTNLVPAVDGDTVFNHAEVTKTGGATQTVEDGDSVRRWRRSDWNAITSPYLRDDGQALTLATELVRGGKDARPPIYSLQLHPVDQATLTQIVTRELGDLITATEDKTGTNVNAYIEKLAVDWDGSKLTSSWTLSKKPPTVAFQFDVSTFDGSAAFVY